MSKDIEVITEDEWFNRMLVRREYEVLFIAYSSGTTRVVDRFTGEVYDVTAKKIGHNMMLEVKRLD